MINAHVIIDCPVFLWYLFPEDFLESGDPLEEVWVAGKDFIYKDIKMLNPYGLTETLLGGQDRADEFYEDIHCSEGGFHDISNQFKEELQEKEIIDKDGKLIGTPEGLQDAFEALKSRMRSEGVINN